MTTIPDVIYWKLCCILHRALSEVRKKALSSNHQDVLDLADTFEILPSLMTEWESGHLGLIRAILADFQARHKDSCDDYLSILEMDDDQFVNTYRSIGGYR